MHGSNSVLAPVAIEYTGLNGTSASVGRVGSHTVIAGRRDGKARGTGVGFNGGELLALFLADASVTMYTTQQTRWVSRSRTLGVAVTIELAGDPLLVRSAAVNGLCELADGASGQQLLERAKERCTVGNSLRAGITVDFL